MFVFLESSFSLFSTLMNSDFFHRWKHSVLYTYMQLLFDGITPEKVEDCRKH